MFYQQALSVLQKRFGPQHPRTRELCEQYKDRFEVLTVELLIKDPTLRMDKHRHCLASECLLERGRMQIKFLLG